MKKPSTIMPLFASPVMQVRLDLDTNKLTEFASEIRDKDKKGVQVSNRGGWQSNNVVEESHEEFIRLKKEINQYLQTYRSEVFRGMVFKVDVVHNLDNMWININEKHHYNEWHVHPFSTLSGTYYIEHNGVENGDILFKHPAPFHYASFLHWPSEMVEEYNAMTSSIVNIIPKSNTLLIFPSWLEHKVETNLKNDTRISLSFNVGMSEKDK